MSFLGSSIGKKYLMGISGVVWAGFVLGHMLGNLLIFVGPDAYNSYGHAITSGAILYITEVVLILALITHVGLAIRLTLENNKAKKSRYAVTPKKEKGGSLASRTMGFQGSLILFFIITHLITFKYGAHYITTVKGVEMRDLHKLIVEIFSQPAAVGWYLVALVILGFHLSHGVGSIFQSFGLKTDEHAPLIKKLSCAYAVIVVAGFISQPLYVYFFAR